MDIRDDFLESVRSRFCKQKELAERAIAQLTDDQLRDPLHPETNSIAIIMKHMAGNMQSRWTEFLTSDGEKPWRHRDREFIDDFSTRDNITENWKSGWATLFEAIDSLAADDLSRTVTIRAEEHTVIDAIHRQLDHYAYHVGQIVLIARLLVGDGEWTTLSIPRGGSEDFNRATFAQHEKSSKS